MKTRSKIITICIFIFLFNLFLINIKSFSSNFNEYIRVPNISSGVLTYRKWGGPYPDTAYAITVDSSNNIYLAGSTESYGALGEDVCIVKYDKSGAILWNKTYGGSDHDVVRAITLDSFGNIYVAGYTESFGISTYNIYLLKLNSLGDLQWNVTWEGEYSSKAFTIELDSQDNIYLGGYFSNAICLWKFNNSGEFEWHIPIPLSGSGNGIAIDTSDNIYLVGTGGYHEDICLLKTNTSGDILMFQIWDRINDIDLGDGIVLDPFNNIYIAGTTWNSETFSYEICLLKYNNLGEFQWFRTWDGVPWEQYLPQYTEDRATGITMDSSGNIFISGYTYSDDPTGKNYDTILLKFNSLGDFEWSQIWGGEKHDYGFGITSDSQNNIYICGGTSSFAEVDDDIDMCVIKYQQNRQTQLIHGYNLFLYLGFLGITTIMIIIVSKKFKKKRK